MTTKNKRTFASKDEVISSIRDGMYTKDWSSFTVDSDLVIGNRDLYSLKNGPKELYGWLDAVGVGLKSLIGAPKTEVLDVSDNKLTSLDGLLGVEIKSLAAEYNDLRTLKGCNDTYTGKFYVNHNKNLKSLKGGPTYVGYSYKAQNCGLTSLEGAPKLIKNGFYCDDNLLTDLIGGPENVYGDYYCTHNKLTSFKGSPLNIVGSFNVSVNPITSIEGIPVNVGEVLNLLGTKITNLKGIHTLMDSCSVIDLRDCPIRSHILGLLKIKKLERITLSDGVLENIINRYLPLGDLLDCQEELIEAGYSEFAQL